MATVAAARGTDVASVAGVVTARMVEARRLRRRAAQIDEDWYDLLCTYNRLWDASDGQDARLGKIDVDLARMRSEWRRLLDRAARLTGETTRKGGAA